MLRKSNTRKWKPDLTIMTIASACWVGVGSGCVSEDSQGASRSVQVQASPAPALVLVSHHQEHHDDGDEHERGYRSKFRIFMKRENRSSYRS